MYNLKSNSLFKEMFYVIECYIHALNLMLTNRHMESLHTVVMFDNQNNSAMFKAKYSTKFWYTFLL